MALSNSAALAELEILILLEFSLRPEFNIESPARPWWSVRRRADESKKKWKIDSNFNFSVFYFQFSLRSEFTLRIQCQRELKTESVKYKIEK